MEIKEYNLKQDRKDVKKLILGCHGFDSSSTSSTFTGITECLKDTDIPLITFDWAGHGQNNEKVTLSNCVRIFHEVETLIHNEYTQAKVYLFGSSFGGYMILYCLSRGLALYPEAFGRYIFLKSPAIQMDKIFKDVLIDESLEAVKERGYTIKNRNKRMVIPYQFYEELSAGIIDTESVNKLSQTLIIYHGKSDDTASIDAVRNLRSPNVMLTELENTPHSFKGKNLKLMALKIKETILRDN